MTVKELLSGPEKWTQGYYAKTKSNGFASATSKEACKFCLVGAIRRCYGDNYSPSREEAETRLRRVLLREYGTINPIDFNDEDGRTFEDVRRVVELADI